MINYTRFISGRKPRKAAPPCKHLWMLNNFFTKNRGLSYPLCNNNMLAKGELVEGLCTSKEEVVTELIQKI